MRAAALALVLCAGCIDVDAYAPLARLEFEARQLVVAVPPGTDLTNFFYDAFALADVDGDGDVDLVYGSVDGSISVRLRQGALQFGPESRSDVVMPAFTGVSLVAADLDGDGAFEIVIPPVDAWRWDAVAGGLRHLDAFEPRAISNTLSASADVDGDGKPEVWFVDQTGLDVRQWDGAHLSPIGHTADPLDTSFTYLLPVDVDGDGGVDLLAFPADSGSSGARVYWHGARSWERSDIVSCGGAVSNMIAVDVDGDGRGDLVVSDNTAHLAWCRGRGDRSYEAPITIGPVDAAGVVRPGDFDRDRRPDLLTQHAQQFDALRLFRNDDGQRFDAYDFSEKLPTFPLLPFARVPRPGPYDLDGDHRLDVVMWAGDGLSWMRNVSR